MNRIQDLHLRTKIAQLVTVIVLWLLAYNTAQGRMCWVDFYEHPQYLGAHIRISGPIELENLRDIHGTDWEDRIDSLIVGKGARTSLFELEGFQQDNTDVYQDPVHMRALGVTSEYGSKQAGLTFNADDQVEYLGVWNFHKKTKSLSIDCIE